MVNPLTVSPYLTREDVRFSQVAWKFAFCQDYDSLLVLFEQWEQPD